MNRELLAIALRNITRNRRRTALNMIALTVGMVIIIASLGWLRGYFTTLYDGMIELDTGHVQILHETYLEEERRMPLDLLVEDYHRTRERLERLPGVHVASGRIHYELELGNGREYAPMRGRAVDSRYEGRITSIEQFISEGRRVHGDGVLIGRTVADLLGVAAGDTVFVRVRDRYGAPNTVALELSGVFRTGYPLFDRYLVVTDLQETAAFLRIDDAVTHLVLRGEGSDTPENLAARIQDALPEELRAYPWQRFARTMIAAVEADIGAFALFLGILFLLILLGILNSMSMTVRERGREIGTMRAIGLKRHQVRYLLITESVLVALISAVAAAALGGVFAAYVQVVGINLAQAMPAELPIPFGDRFHGDYRIVDFLIATGFGIGAAVLGSLLPVRRAVRTEIVTSMRSSIT